MQESNVDMSSHVNAEDVIVTNSEALLPVPYTSTEIHGHVGNTVTKQYARFSPIPEKFDDDNSHPSTPLTLEHANVARYTPAPLYMCETSEPAFKSYPQLFLLQSSAIGVIPDNTIEFSPPAIC